MPYVRFNLIMQDATLGVYEAALRFYINEDNRKLSKAIRVKTTDTVDTLLPVLGEKFGVNTRSSSATSLQVLQVTDGGEFLTRYLFYYHVSIRHHVRYTVTCSHSL